MTAIYKRTAYVMLSDFGRVSNAELVRDIAGYSGLDDLSSGIVPDLSSRPGKGRRKVQIVIMVRTIEAPKPKRKKPIAKKCPPLPSGRDDSFALAA